MNWTVTLFLLSMARYCVSRPSKWDLDGQPATYGNSRQQFIPTYNKAFNGRSPYESRYEQIHREKTTNETSPHSNKTADGGERNEPSRTHRRFKNEPSPSQSYEILLTASAGEKNKTTSTEDDDEDAKTLLQQIAEGKYGLIQKELHSKPPKQPGILSYSSNPEVPKDTDKNLGGLEPDDIWLAEDHVLVLKGGKFPDHKGNRTVGDAVWPPIDNYKAPPRQVKLPLSPNVPPPFPVQLTENGPTVFIGPNGTKSSQPFFFPIPPPGNGSYFAPPFPLPHGNISPPFIYQPPGNYPPGGGGFFPPPGINGSLSPPPYPFPLPGNGSLYGPPPFRFPPPGNIPPGSGFPPQFPFPPPQNGSLPPFALPPFFPPLPPGAAVLPPPGLLNETIDEDDPSIYYPPPYDFYYPKDNATEVPPGPLVPGIILPPPPNFFAPLQNSSSSKHQDHRPSTQTPPRPTYLPPQSSGIRPTTKTRLSSVYTPITTEVRKKKPPKTTTPISLPDSIPYNEVTTETPILTTIPIVTKGKVHSDDNQEKFNYKAPEIQPVINIEITNSGKPTVNPPKQRYYYETVNTKRPTFLSDEYEELLKSITFTTPATVVVVPLQKVPATSRPIHIQFRQKEVNVNKPQQPVYAEPNPIYVYEVPSKIQVSTTAVPLVRQKDYNSNPQIPPGHQFTYEKEKISTTISPEQSYFADNNRGSKASFYFYEEPEDAVVGKSVQSPRQQSTTEVPWQIYRVLGPTLEPVLDALKSIIRISNPKPNSPSYYNRNQPSHKNIYYDQPHQQPPISNSQLLYYLAGRLAQQNLRVQPSPQNYYPSRQQPLYKHPDSNQGSQYYANTELQAPVQYSQKSNLQYSPFPTIRPPQAIFQYDYKARDVTTESPQNVFNLQHENNGFQEHYSARFVNRGNNFETGDLIGYHRTTPKTIFEYKFETNPKHALQSTEHPAIKSVLNPTKEIEEQSKEYNFQLRDKGFQGQFIPYTDQNSETTQTVTPNPIKYFTQQDENVFDENTLKYFTIFGKKLPTEEEKGATKINQVHSTTPITIRQHSSQKHRKNERPGLAEDLDEYYTTPKTILNKPKDESQSSYVQSEDQSPVAIPLESDILVNYRDPLPPINPDSEFISQSRHHNTKDKGSLISYQLPGDGAHFYFLTPQAVTNQQWSQQNGRQNFQSTNNADTLRYRRRNNRRSS